MTANLLESLKEVDRSTVILTILSLISLLVIYFQHKKVLLSPYTSYGKTQTGVKENEASSKGKMARCRECSTLKPISQLKMCSKCKVSTQDLSRHPSSDLVDLQFYYCDQTCQKANWKSHKLVCGSFKNLQPALPTTGSLDPSHSNNLFNPGSENQTLQIQTLLKKWCDFHRNLLIFATIHGLDLIRNPQNSASILLMISLNFKDDADPAKRIIEITDQVDSPAGIHEQFTVGHIGSLDLTNFFNANPGMSKASEEMAIVRTRVKEKGGIGVAMLLVRCGAVVHVIPVGLPSQADLDAVPRQPKWRALFDEAIKSGVPWTPPSSSQPVSQ